MCMLMIRVYYTIFITYDIFMLCGKAGNKSLLMLKLLLKKKSYTKSKDKKNVN